ncbi:response regulator SirA [Phyllobacterium salinisoli]|uniref:Response regulator SirA n=1 Tax=Phyllobacterium salinisoli TaxID=1899321 RepID=A0A368JZG8_9HYPH|nr:sulfurtransferase TusA family protein [Phyllobacterium salinisoli]RCS22361.1 response regulator SirA [Phyllobacterium salinisoli]
MPEKHQSIEIYDLKGLNCPLPVLKTRRKLQDVPPGSCLWVETSDPLAGIDIPHFCTENGHSLIEIVTVENGHRFLIRKT